MNEVGAGSLGMRLSHRLYLYYNKLYNINTNDIYQLICSEMIRKC